MLVGFIYTAMDHANGFSILPRPLRYQCFYAVESARSCREVAQQPSGRTVSKLCFALLAVQKANGALSEDRADDGHRA